MQVDVNGTRLWFDVEGSALVPEGSRMCDRPSVVLLHGGPGTFDHTVFRPDFTRLSQVAQVIYLDLRGHGRSSREDPARWNFDACADDLRAFCDHLGIVDPIVFAHSLGGYIAMVYAVRHRGHAAALVLQSTMARFDFARVVEGFRRVGGDEVAAIAARFYGGDASVTAEYRARCRPLFGRWVPGDEERARMIVNEALLGRGLELIRGFDVRDRLARVDCPTLVSVGDRDPVTQVADARDIVAALPDGVAQLAVIEGAGHFPWKDAPDRFWAILGDFIARVGESRGRVSGPGGIG